MIRIALLGILLVATAASAAVLDMTAQGQGTLATAQAVTGASANEASFGVSGRRGAATFQTVNTAGTATVELQQTCLQSGGTSTNWITLANTSTTLTVGAGLVTVSSPGCSYRANVTACTGCSVTVTATSIGK